MKRFKKRHYTLLESFSHAWSGIKHAIYAQRQLKIHCFFFCFIVILGILLSLSTTEWMALLISAFLVIICEMINTSIELLVDLATKQHKIRAKLSKDVAAGAVLISAINATIVGYLIFYDKLANVFLGG